MPKKRCPETKGCWDKWCPYSRWCILSPNHISDCTFETGGEAARRRGHVGYTLQAEGFRKGAKVHVTGDMRRRGVIVDIYPASNRVYVKWPGQEQTKNEYQVVTVDKLTIIQREIHCEHEYTTSPDASTGVSTGSTDSPSAVPIHTLRAGPEGDE